MPWVCRATFTKGVCELLGPVPLVVCAFGRSHPKGDEGEGALQPSNSLWELPR